MRCKNGAYRFFKIYLQRRRVASRSLNYSSSHHVERKNSWRTVQRKIANTLQTANSRQKPKQNDNSELITELRMNCYKINLELYVEIKRLVHSAHSYLSIFVLLACQTFHIEVVPVDDGTPRIVTNLGLSHLENTDNKVWVVWKGISLCNCIVYREIRSFAFGGSKRKTWINFGLWAIICRPLVKQKIMSESGIFQDVYSRIWWSCSMQQNYLLTSGDECSNETGPAHGGPRHSPWLDFLHYNLWTSSRASGIKLRQWNGDQNVYARWAYWSVSSV